MNDETPRTPSATGAEHYWSMEHHSYRPPVAEQPPAPPAASASVAGATARGWSGRLVAATVLGVALAAGVGSFAVAQASDSDDAGQGAATAQAVQPDRGDGGPGGRPDGGFGRHR
ncbi:MAG: hypothetical protein JWR55_982 [Aeromicrobium sp.]|jgi:hypothetical protein|nr:hypothetical protein [Aeromicrobium sp.]